jgi:hypothetical protein
MESLSSPGGGVLLKDHLIPAGTTLTLDLIPFCPEAWRYSLDYRIAPATPGLTPHVVATPTQGNSRDVPFYDDSATSVSGDFAVATAELHEHDIHGSFLRLSIAVTTHDAVISVYGAEW